MVQFLAEVIFIIPLLLDCIASVLGFSVSVSERNLGMASGIAVRTSAGRGYGNKCFTIGD